jgi:hypothetical protein
MSKTFIVLIPVSGSVSEPRKACELIENTTFIGATTETEVLGRVIFELGITTSEGIEVDFITDFMDRVNNEEFDQGDYFISYVNN